MIIQLGNPAAKHSVTRNGRTTHEDLPGRRITTVNVPDSYTTLEMLAAITAPDGVWNNHTRGDTVDDVTPDWVDCVVAGDDELAERGRLLAQMIGAQLGCRVGKPRGWKEQLDDDTPEDRSTSDGKSGARARDEGADE